MSQDPNKFDPKETTEAKLCAYVDGELDAAGRAEIEKYLQTNPQHRKLIEELKQTRDLMRALPRASAPPDIGEMLQGQLERSVLLNELDTEPAADSMRISRAAQFRAVAAVILLALGLGAVVYFVLPSSNQRVAVVAPLPTDHELTGSSTQIVPEIEDSSRSIAGAPKADSPTALTSAPAPVASPAPVAVAQADPFLRRDMDRAKVSGKSGDVLVRRDAKMKGGDISGAAPYAAKTVAGIESQKLTDAINAQQGDPFRARVQQRLANVSQGQSPANYTCVVVSTADPAGTKQRVNTFLVSNKIQWQPVEEPMPQPIQFGQSQVAMTSRLNQTNVQLRRGEEALGGPSTYFNNSKTVSNGLPQSPGTQILVNSVPASGPVAEQNRALASTQPGEKDSLALNQPAPTQAQQSAPSQATQVQQQVQAQQPTEAQQPMRQQAAAQPTTDEQQVVAQAQEPTQQMEQKGAEVPVELSDQYIFARNMTTEQTVELKALLAREGGSQNVEVFDASPEGVFVATTQVTATSAQVSEAPTTQSLAGGVARAGGGFGGSSRLAVEKPQAAVPATSEIPWITTAPATQLLALQKRLKEISTTEPVDDKTEQLSLQPSTKPTQDVVIVLRNDGAMTQSQRQAANEAPTTAPAIAPAQIQIPQPPAPVPAASAPPATQASP